MRTDAFTVVCEPPTAAGSVTPAPVSLTQIFIVEQKDDKGDVLYRAP